MSGTSTSKLLKMARARDDQDLILRTAAALTVRAHEIQGWDLPVDTRALVVWVLANPMSEVKRALSFIVSNPAVSEKIAVTNGVINSDAVTDDEIQFVVNESFDKIATAVRQHGTN